MRAPTTRASSVIGLTDDSLHSDGSWGPVFGSNWPDERVGVFTFERAVPSVPQGTNVTEDPFLLARYLNAASHEIGHAFGFAHCTFFRCIMSGAMNVDEAGQRPMHACPVCLRKLQWATRVSVPARYRRLAAFYMRYGLASDAVWTAERLRELSQRA
jgi:archaemetzincin